MQHSNMQNAVTRQHDDSTVSKRRPMTWLLAAAAVAAAFAAGPAAADDLSDPVNAIEAASNLRLSAFGLTADQRLVKFQVAVPQILRQVGTVLLSQPDTALVGMDFRVQDGKLYGVGNAGGIYTIDTGTAVATKVSQLSVALNGKFFGVDFNPAADRLRIVSDAGQNLSHNVNVALNGTTPQDNLIPPPNTPTAVTAVAYTNNDLDAGTGTTLFDIDTMSNLVTIQSPPQIGRLATVGSLTVDSDTWAGFDIYTSIQKGVAVRNSGFASLMVNGVNGLYRVNLTTGKASLVGNFRDQVVDIAFPLNQ